MSMKCGDAIGRPYLGPSEVDELAINKWVEVERVSRPVAAMAGPEDWISVIPKFGGARDPGVPTLRPATHVWSLMKPCRA
jgi:hypothetical protein